MGAIEEITRLVADAIGHRMTISTHPTASAYYDCLTCGETVANGYMPRQVHRAELVVAAIRAMTPAQQAELIGGGEQSRRVERGGPRESRVIGPWRLMDAQPAPTPTDPVPGAHTGAQPSQEDA